jgi:hypothetical protein
MATISHFFLSRIESALGIKKPASASISEWLKSGEELCELMNKLRPGTIPK